MSPRFRIIKCCAENRGKIFYLNMLLFINFQCIVEIFLKFITLYKLTRIGPNDID